MELILNYLTQTYQPLSIIVYGSYADGSNNAYSDFDALLITKDGGEHHDVTIVGGVQLDVFVYPACKFAAGFDANAVLQIYDGRIFLDTDGIGAGVQAKVLDFIAQLPVKSAEERHEELEWCKKMLLRAKRGDSEGYYRWHWLLTDSLPIVCDILCQPYFGPKKTLRWLNANHPGLYQAYADVLAGFNLPALENWISSLEKYNTQ